MLNCPDVVIMNTGFILDVFDQWDYSIHVLQRTDSLLPATCASSSRLKSNQHFVTVLSQDDYVRKLVVYKACRSYKNCQNTQIKNVMNIIMKFKITNDVLFINLRLLEAIFVTRLPKEDGYHPLDFCL